MKTTLAILVLSFCAQDAHNYNILAIFPLNARSHFVMFERLLKGLAAKGHEIDVVSHYPQKNSVPRYNDLSIRDTIEDFTNNLPISFMHKKSLMYVLEDTMAPSGYFLCDVLFNTTILKELRNTTKKYDLLITEIFGTDCMLGFGHIYKIPVVALTSSVPLPWCNDRFGNPDNPSYIPNYYVPYLSRMTFLERLHNTLTLILAKTTYDRISMDNSNRAAREFFGPDLPALRDLAYQTSLLLVNSHHSLNTARPTVPNVVEIGGLHIREPKPLPKYLEDIIKGSPKGVVYLSLGSMLQTESFEPEKLQAMFDAFGELGLAVLWKADRTLFPEGLRIPENIHFEKWLPQLDILCHPNVKLFVSHGGLMGTQEAVYCGVPTLGIPFFSDQFLNVKNSEALGLLIQVNYDDITKGSILNALKRLTQDPTFKNNAEKVSNKFKDRQNVPLETAVFWTEYVIRHRGAPELRSVGADLPWYQYYLVDVVSFCVRIIVLILYLVYFLLVKIVSLFRADNRHVKIKRS